MLKHENQQSDAISDREVKMARFVVGEGGSTLCSHLLNLRVCFQQRRMCAQLNEVFFCLIGRIVMIYAKKYLKNFVFMAFVSGVVFSVFASPVFGNVTGAIFTTNSDCGGVDLNIYKNSSRMFISTVGQGSLAQQACRRESIMFRSLHRAGYC